MDPVRIVQQHYDEGVAAEWERLEHHRVEFEINRRFLLRHIQPGDRVLDIGGGPGRYSLFLSEYGCDVTLADLSQGNVDFASAMARERGLALRAMQADARHLSSLSGKAFDHVLLMGPLYHLSEEADRIRAVGECMNLLKPGGILACSFISSYAGMIYMMKYEPALLASNPMEEEYMRLFLEDLSFAGQAFTHAYFIRRADVLPFFARFPLEKLHFLASEGMLAPCEEHIYAQPGEVQSRWLDLVEKTCEREDLLSFAEHFLYIGRKTA